MLIIKETFNTKFILIMVVAHSSLIGNTDSTIKDECATEE